MLFKIISFLLSCTLFALQVMAQKETASLTEIWEDGQWINQSKSSFEYDSLRRCIAIKQELWNKPLAVWENLKLSNMTFDSMSRLDEKIIKKWDSQSQSWIYSEFEYFVYKGKETTMHKKKWDGYTWSLVQKTYTKMDSLDNDIEFISYLPDMNTNEVLPFNRKLSTRYPNGDIREMLNFRWDKLSQAWIQNLKLRFRDESIAGNSQPKTERLTKDGWEALAETSSSDEPEKSYYTDGRLFQSLFTFEKAKGEKVVQRTTYRY